MVVHHHIGAAKQLLAFDGNQCGITWTGSNEKHLTDAHARHAWDTSSDMGMEGRHVTRPQPRTTQ